jgi:hypothetical protein
MISSIRTVALTATLNFLVKAVFERAPGDTLYKDIQPNDT